jgi:ribosomal protein S8
MAPIHHLCSQLQNASKAKLRRIAVPFSKANKSICNILYTEGLLSGVSTGDVTGPFERGYPVPVTTNNISRMRLWIDLKYRSGMPALSTCAVVSKPSRRIFASAEELRVVASGRKATPLIKAQTVGQITIVNTPYGIVELREALSKSVGGEILCMAT